MTSTQTMVQVKTPSINDKLCILKETNTGKSYNNEELCISEDDNNVAIYRYKFSANIIELLTSFGKTHQYDPTKIYQEAWNIFVEKNKDTLQEEVDRLKNIGYDGDCYDKMYKSGRYYFRKKSLTKSEPKKRRKYISCDRELLDAMDDHIEVGLRNNDFKPALGYDDFVVENTNMILDEITRMINNGFDNKEAIVKKIKKTYKNRYFQIIKRTQ